MSLDWSRAAVAWCSPWPLAPDPSFCRRDEGPAVLPPDQAALDRDGRGDRALLPRGPPGGHACPGCPAAAPGQGSGGRASGAAVLGQGGQAVGAPARGAVLPPSELRPGAPGGTRGCTGAGQGRDGVRLHPDPSARDTEPPAGAAGGPRHRAAGLAGRADLLGRRRHPNRPVCGQQQRPPDHPAQRGLARAPGDGPEPLLPQARGSGPPSRGHDGPSTSDHQGARPSGPCRHRVV